MQNRGYRKMSTHYIQYLIDNSSIIIGILRKETRLRDVDDLFQDMVLDALSKGLDGDFETLLRRQIHTMAMRVSRTREKQSSCFEIRETDAEVPPVNTDSLDFTNAVKEIPSEPHRTVLQMMADGFTTREIAKRVGISRQTVLNIATMAKEALRKRFDNTNSEDK